MCTGQVTFRVSTTAEFSGDTNSTIVIELKHNGTTESALNQIREEKYFDSMAHYKGNLLFIGVNYDEKSKIHTCRIEQMLV